MAAIPEPRVAEAELALAGGDYAGALEATLASLAAADSGAARFLLGVLYLIDDRFVEAMQELEVAFRMLRDEGDLRAAARAAIELAGLHVGAFGHLSAGSGWVERARMVLDRVGPCVEWGHLELAAMACDRPDAEDLLASAERALAIAVEFGDGDLEVRALADSGLALVTAGRSREGFARLDAALAGLTAGEASMGAGAVAFCSMLSACDRTGDVRRAEEWTSIISGMIAPLGDRPRILRTHCRVTYGSVLCSIGRWAEGEALLLQALGPAEEPNLGHRALTTAHLAGLRIDQGRIDDAAELLAPFEDWVTSCGPLARVHLRRGRPDLAAAVLEQGLGELVGDALRASSLWTLLVEAELARGDVAAARAAAGRLGALASSVDVAMLRADAAVAAGRVLVAEGDTTGAVQAYHEAKGHLGDERQPKLATVRLELAEVLAAAGAGPAAIAEARAALACFERLGVTDGRDRAAALLRSLGDTGRVRGTASAEALADLTGREQEVLTLVCGGLTNAQIGERLYISPKTAEHHVGRILTKLGVRSRAEAAALAVRLGARGHD